MTSERPNFQTKHGEAMGIYSQHHSLEIKRLFCEFKCSLISTVSSKKARGTERNEEGIVIYVNRENKINVYKTLHFAHP